MNKNINKYIINQNLTIYDALVLIEENIHRSLIVVDDNNTVVGTISDGDIRKSLIRHRLLSTPIFQIMNVNFIWLYESQKELANEHFKNKNIFIIPILNEQKQITDILLSY